MSGPAAYALARALNSDDITDRLAERGLGRQWQELALAVIEAIRIEAQAWSADAQRHLDQCSEDGTPAGSGSANSPSSVEMNDVLTVREAAGRLAISERRVRALVAAGRLPGRKPDHSWLLDATAVADLARRRNEEN